MASNVIKGVSVNNIVRRSFAAQASASAKQQAEAAALSEQQLQLSNLPNGGVVASLENNSPISRISIFVRSGSRYETPDTLGVSHVARLCVGLKTKKFTAFGITRRTQQFGGTLVCESGREHVAYTLTCVRDHLHEGFEILSDVALRPTFRPWEVATLQSRLVTEVGARPPAVLATELLHAAAFRDSPLGRPLFVPHHRVGLVTPDQLHEFVKGTHTAPRLAFVGVGVDHIDFFKLARDVGDAPLGPGVTSSPGAYGGGEVRHEDGSATACVALAAPGAKLDGEEALALTVAQFALGSPPGTKYGTNASSKLAALVDKAGGRGRATPINAQYTDGGLFGVLIEEESAHAGEVVRAVSKGIRTLKLTEAEVLSAKAKAKSAILMGIESVEGEVEELGLQVLFTGKYSTRDQVASAIDKIPSAAVQSALSNAVKGKPSMAAVGGISKVPYLDQL